MRINLTSAEANDLVEYSSIIKDDTGQKYIDFRDIVNFESINVDEFRQTLSSKGMDIDTTELISFAKSIDYIPKVIIRTASISDKPTNDTFNVTISGEFLDSVYDVQISALDNTGVDITEVSKSFSEITLEVTTNNIPQQYDIIISSTSGVSILPFDTVTLVQIIPTIDGSGASLWQQPTPLPSNNEVTLGDGRFEAEQNNGEGWNNHAFYGNFTGAFTKIVHEFVTNNDTNAYCYIRFNNTTNVGTAGNPRIYISNATSLQVFSDTGASISSTAVANGDLITVEFTSTTMEVFVNGEPRVQSTGNYTNAMQGSYVTFTSFRFTILTGIVTKLIE